MPEKVSKVSPWVAYVNALTALFSGDPQVHIEYDNDECVVKLFVDSHIKAEALVQLLPDKVDFGTITLMIYVYPPNREEDETIEDLFRHAFAGNKAVNEFIRNDEIFTNPIVYMVFKKEVVQYFNDDLGDPHGNRSTLYQEIANEIFPEHDGILFCTDKEG